MNLGQRFRIGPCGRPGQSGKGKKRSAISPGDPTTIGADAVSAAHDASSIGSGPPTNSRSARNSGPLHRRTVSGVLVRQVDYQEGAAQSAGLDDYGSYLTFVYLRTRH